jgi:hypothetical protein
VSLAYQHRGVVLSLPLHAEAAKLVDRLRRQADVAHDWNARFDNVSDDILMPGHALELDRLRPAGDESADRLHRGGDTHAKGEEWEVRDQELAGCRTGDRASVDGHQFHGRGQRRRVAVDHHGGGITDENGVHVRPCDEPGRPRVVGGDHRYLPPLLFEPGETVNGLHAALANDAGISERRWSCSNRFSPGADGKPRRLG